MNPRKQLLKIIFAGGLMLGFIFIPITSLLGGTLDVRAFAGGLFWLSVSVPLIISIIRRGSLKTLFLGMAIGSLVVAFNLWHQQQYGFVFTYVGRGGFPREQVDWHLHPAIAFYAAAWLAVAIPALFAYYSSRSKQP